MIQCRPVFDPFSLLQTTLTIKITKDFARRFIKASNPD
jgi:hypothetical protein